MADQFDRASELEELERQHAIARQVGRTDRRLVPTGKCLNCDDPVRTGMFCDCDCRTDYERRARAKRF